VIPDLEEEQYEIRPHHRLLGDAEARTEGADGDLRLGISNSKKAQIKQG
jgi:hypothetical protein